MSKIIKGDCVSVMRSWEDNVINLTVTSPPYDNLREYNGYSFDYKAMARELFRITKEGGVVVWVVGDATIKGSETGTSFEQALYFKKIGFNLHDTMIYEKTGFPFPMSNRYYQSFEYMFVFSKGKPKTTNLIKDRKNIYAGQKVAREHGLRMANGEVIENSANKIDKKRQIKEYGVRFNIWRIVNSSSKGDKIALKHPASFPEKLAEDHILSWSNEGDVVLDPMCGSGTTCKMAILNNRNYFGIDCSEEYCNISKQRIEDALHEDKE